MSSPMKPANTMSASEYAAARAAIRRGEWPPRDASPTSAGPSPATPGSAKTASEMTADEYARARQRIKRGLPPV